MKINDCECGSKNVKVLTGYTREYCNVMCLDCKRIGSTFKVIEDAVDEWNKLTPNKAE